MEYLVFDNFWDIESFENVYTVAYYYPSRKALEVEFIDDDNLGLANPQVQYTTAQKLVEFFNINHELDIDAIRFINLKTVAGAVNYIKRFGVATSDTLIDRTKIPNQKSLIASQHQYRILKPLGEFANWDEYWYYPVKDTDRDYDPNVHGRFFGYNSTNYDETVTSAVIHELLAELNAVFSIKADKSIEQMIQEHAKNGFTDVVLRITAKRIRQTINNPLFDDYKNNMPEFLQYEDEINQYGNTYKRRNFNSDRNATRRAWRLTNRFIDVSRLNEKMSKIALKRVMSYLGLTIKEADTSNNVRVKDLNDLIDRIIYNASDVVNLRYVFEHKAYAVPYDLHGKLLERYPQTIYMHNGDEITPDIDPLKIRTNRLTYDSTSAKFVEFIVSPYKPLTDNETVSYMYPSKSAIKRIKRLTGKTIKQFDVLEETHKWFLKNVTDDPTTEAYQSWMQVYNFYDSIRGKNFNSGKQYREDYPHMEFDERTKSSVYITELMEKYNTNIFYYNRDLTKSSCYATMSIGGIHGAEIHQRRYKYDCDLVEIHNRKVQQIKDMTENGTVKEALNDLPAKVTLPSGEEVKVRDFIKNPKKTPTGNEKNPDEPYGEWKLKEKPELFSLKKRQNSDLKKWELAEKYKYVSTGMANHEDFASYYPLLLSMLSAFENVARGLDENGEYIDVYYELFQTRLTEKNRAKDLSLPEDVRDLAETTQLLMKLLINAASGVGDGNFDTNLRVNNKVIAMRIIGQLFSYRIGQAETLAGAKVPSTNTDGLYTMNISPEKNNKVLFDTVADMYVDIEPEVLTNFISKDSNNRLEIHINKKTGKEEIAAANGGSLTAWQGPAPVNNLAHPAIVDRILAEYLWKKENAANKHFDREFARQLYIDFVNDHLVSDEKRFELSRFYQWILASSPNTQRYLYQKETQIVNETEKTVLIPMQHYNRGFLVKLDFLNKVRELKGQPQIKKLETLIASKDSSRPKVMDAPEILDAVKIHKLNGYFAHKENQYSKTVKVNGLDPNMTVFIDNETQINKCKPNQYNEFGADFIEHVIDHEAYLDLVQDTFESSWYNVQEEFGEFDKKPMTRLKKLEKELAKK